MTFECLWCGRPPICECELRECRNAGHQWVYSIEPIIEKERLYYQRSKTFTHCERCLVPYQPPYGLEALPSIMNTQP